MSVDPFQRLPLGTFELPGQDSPTSAPSLDTPGMRSLSMLNIAWLGVQFLWAGLTLTLLLILADTFIGSGRVPGWLIAVGLAVGAAVLSTQRDSTLKLSGTRAPLPEEQAASEWALNDVHGTFPTLRATPLRVAVSRAITPPVDGLPQVTVTTTALQSLSPTTLRSVLVHNATGSLTLPPQLVSPLLWAALPGRIFSTAVISAARRIVVGWLGLWRKGCLSMILAFFIVPVVVAVLGLAAAWLLSLLGDHAWGVYLLATPLLVGPIDRARELAADRATADLGYADGLAEALSIAAPQLPPPGAPPRSPLPKPAWWRRATANERLQRLDAYLRGAA